MSLKWSKIKTEIWKYTIPYSKAKFFCWWESCDKKESSRKATSWTLWWDWTVTLVWSQLRTCYSLFLRNKEKGSCVSFIWSELWCRPHLEADGGWRSAPEEHEACSCRSVSEFRYLSSTGNHQALGLCCSGLSSVTLGLRGLAPSGSLSPRGSSGVWLSSSSFELLPLVNGPGRDDGGAEISCYQNHRDPEFSWCRSLGSVEEWWRVEVRGFTAALRNGWGPLWSSCVVVVAPQCL